MGVMTAHDLRGGANGLPEDRKEGRLEWRKIARRDFYTYGR